MGMFINPLSHAGYPPGVTGTPETQPSEVRAATPAEAIAGVLDNVYISPLTLSGSGSDLGPRTLHGVLLGEGVTNPLGATAAGTDGQVLTGNTSADPSFAAIGTKSGLTAHGVLIAENAGAFQATAAGSAGQLLASGGASANPVWTTATFPATVGSAGTFIRSDGTNWVASTATLPNTTTANQILYSSGTSVVGQITTANNGVLGTNGSGVPSFSVAASYVPAFSLATAGDSAWTYTGTPFGRFIQVGPVVYFSASITWSAFSNTTGSGVWRVSLPAAAGAFVLPGQIAIQGSGINAGAETANLPANFYGKIASGASVCTLSVQEGGTGNAAAASFDLTVTQVASAGTLTISGFYFVA